MELPKGRYPQSDTKAPAVRHCGTQSPTLRVAQSDTAGTPQQKVSGWGWETKSICHGFL